MDCSPPGSYVYGISQARILEWVAIFFSRGSNLGILHCRQSLYHLSHQGSQADFKNEMTYNNLRKDKCTIFWKKKLHFSMWCMHAQSCPTLKTSWTVARQAPLPMTFSRHKYCSELPFPSPGDPPDSGIKPISPPLLADLLPLSHLGSP